MERWEEAQKWEAGWWGNCVNTLGEEMKQLTYAKRMGLNEFKFHNKKSPYNFDMRGKTIIDIGGGPVSLLLKCENVAGTVCDPLVVPEWVKDRYKITGVYLRQQPAEDLEQAKLWDEAWIYNTLQHVQNPDIVVEKAKAIAKLIRVFEWIGTAENIGHPHVLTEALLNEWLGGEGKVEKLTGENTCYGTAYYGIFPTN